LKYAGEKGGRGKEEHHEKSNSYTLSDLPAVTPGKKRFQKIRIG